ncbi:hypothetical protein OF83DRAFT_371375 [Amylostereum chailletii]|nr:hypothetical protein OF83DRAFT_371375 [Amylostereum chailletii]
MKSNGKEREQAKREGQPVRKKKKETRRDEMSSEHENGEQAGRGERLPSFRVVRSK